MTAARVAGYERLVELDHEAAEVTSEPPRAKYLEEPSDRCPLRILATVRQQLTDGAVSPDVEHIIRALMDLGYPRAGSRVAAIRLHRQLAVTPEPCPDTLRAGETPAGETMTTAGAG
jgi:hypothetical protein